VKTRGVQALVVYRRGDAFVCCRAFWVMNDDASSRDDRSAKKERICGISAYYNGARRIFRGMKGRKALSGRHAGSRLVARGAGAAAERRKRRPGFGGNRDAGEKRPDAEFLILEHSHLDKIDIENSFRKKPVAFGVGILVKRTPHEGCRGARKIRFFAVCVCDRQAGPGMNSTFTVGDQLRRQGWRGFSRCIRHGGRRWYSGKRTSRTVRSAK